MRLNVYSQELTSEISRVTKYGTDNEGRPAQFHGIRLYLHSAPQLHHTPADDDRSALTIWLPRSLGRRVELAIALRALAAWAEGDWPGGWPGWQDGPESLAVKVEAEKLAQAAQADHNELAAQVEPRIPGLVEQLMAARTAQGAREVADEIEAEKLAQAAQADHNELAAQVEADRRGHPESWRGYPAPHYDEGDDCPCPDHRAMREARSDPRFPGLVEQALARADRGPRPETPARPAPEGGAPPPDPG
jgi:hypothetical protein